MDVPCLLQVELKEMELAHQEAVKALKLVCAKDSTTCNFICTVPSLATEAKLI